MTGDVDYQLRIVARSLAEYENFLRDKLTRKSTPVSPFVR